MHVQGGTNLVEILLAITGSIAMDFSIKFVTNIVTEGKYSSNISQIVAKLGLK